MNRFLAAYLAVAMALIAVDMLWLRVFSKSMYRQAIGHLMAAQPRVAAAALFYALYAVGLMVFAIVPQAQDPAWAPRTPHTTSANLRPSRAGRSA